MKKLSVICMVFVSFLSAHCGNAPGLNLDSLSTSTTTHSMPPAIIASEGTIASPVNLALATVYSGSAAAGSSYYQITGLASTNVYSISLTNLSAAVTLQVYSDAAFANLICTSATGSLNAESCLVKGLTACYLQVTASNQATYSAQVSLWSEGNINTPVSVPYNTLYPGQVGLGDSYYSVSPQIKVFLFTVSASSPTGDVDLFVYSDPVFQTLLCSSVTTGLANESCACNKVPVCYIRVQNKTAATQSFQLLIK